MASFQSKLLRLYFLSDRFFSSPNKEFNLNKERLKLDRFAKMVWPSAPLKFEPANVNGIAGEWITPSSVSGRRTILYLHGGYYLIGSIQSHRTLAGNIAIAAQARAMMIDYRLAPEHPFPAGLEDCLTAYHWLLAQGIKPSQVFLAGDSAGGGLVLATLLALRDRQAPLPSAGICLSPVTDLSLSGESWKSNLKRDVVISQQIVNQVNPLYLRETDPHHPLASPLFADLHGLPPILIQVGSHEILLSDSTAFAAHAKNSGVDVTLEIWPEMQHVWQFAANGVPEARQAVNRIGDYIKNIAACEEAATLSRG